MAVFAEKCALLHTENRHLHCVHSAPGRNDPNPGLSKSYLPVLMLPARFYILSPLSFGSPWCLTGTGRQFQAFSYQFLLRKQAPQSWGRTDRADFQEEISFSSLLCGQKTAAFLDTKTGEAVLKLSSNIIHLYHHFQAWRWAVAICAFQCDICKWPAWQLPAKP